MTETFWKDLVSLGSACLYWNDLPPTDDLKKLFKQINRIQNDTVKKTKILSAKKNV